MNNATIVKKGPYLSLKIVEIGAFVQKLWPTKNLICFYIETSITCPLMN